MKDRTVTPNFIHDPVKNKKKKKKKTKKPTAVKRFVGELVRKYEMTRQIVRIHRFVALFSLSLSLRVHQVYYISILYYLTPTVKFDALLCNILLCNKQVYYEKYKSKRKEHFGLFIRIRVGMPVAQKKRAFIYHLLCAYTRASKAISSYIIYAKRVFFSTR